MTDEQILGHVKAVQKNIGRRSPLLEEVVDALEDRLAVQDWACGGGGELNIPDDE